MGGELNFPRRKIMKSGDFMMNIERLKLELSNRNYLQDAEYAVLLEENGISDPYGDYDPIHKRELLLTVLDVLEILSNDIDNFRKVETEFATTGAAYEALSDRISKVKNKIAAYDSETGQRCETSLWSMFFGGLY